MSDRGKDALRELARRASGDLIPRPELPEDVEAAIVRNQAARVAIAEMLDDLDEQTGSVNMDAIFDEWKTLTDSCATMVATITALTQQLDGARGELRRIRDESSWHVGATQGGDEC